MSKRYFHLRFCLVVLSLFVTTATGARTLVGQEGDARIRLQTVELEGGEFVDAAVLTEYFPNQWRYDSISRTLILFRPDGTRISMQAGDPRVLIGQTIEQTSSTPVMNDGRFMIPFYYVYSFLFPDVQFQEEDLLSEVTTPTGTPLPDNENRFLFRTPTPYPTRPVRPFVFQPASTPTPLPAVREEQPAEDDTLVLVLDPGNDGLHKGASARNNVREHTITLELCQRIAAGIEQDSDIRVLLTHRSSGDVAVSNAERIALANQNQADLFISIHCGSFLTGETSRGAVYFMNSELDDSPEYGLYFHASGSATRLWHEAYTQSTAASARIAQRLLNTLQLVYDVAGVIELDENPRPGRFAILRGLTMPGILIELGNLADPQTARYLTTDRIQQEIADELSIVIMNTLYEQSVQTNESGVQ